LPGAKKSRVKKRISAILRIIVAAIAIIYVLHDQDLGLLGKKFLDMNWFIFALSCLIFAFSNCVFVFRWGLLLRTQDIHIPYFAALKLHFLGLFYNNCLPGAVGGDLLRAWYVTHHTDKKVEAALSVFVDRAIGLGCTVIMASFCYWLILKSEDMQGFEIARRVSDGNGLISTLIVVIAFVIGFMLLVVLLLSFTEKGRGRLRKIYSRVYLKASKLLKKLLIAAKLYLSKPFTILFAMILTFFLQSLAIIGIWLVSRNLGIQVQVKYFLMFFPISWIIGTIPISVGGAGVMEGVLEVLFYKISLVAKKYAVIPGLVQRAIWLITSIPGLSIHIKGAHLPVDNAEFLVDSEPDLG